MPLLASALLLAIAIPAAGSCLYLLTLTLLSARATVPARSTRNLRFDVVIPAHNEAAGIAAAVESVRRVDWPADRFRVIVVADNCTDDTAGLAAEAGAHVLVRRDDQLRGKGHALAHAFRFILQEAWADAVTVIDADSRVSANLLEAIAARVERGERAVQVHYGVSNIDASWRTRLMAIAMAAFHRVRSRARERLRLSCGIRGNGWALSRTLMLEVPYTSYSLAEDLEFGVELGLRGIRVAYIDEASCEGEMVSTEKSARSQRRRWEQGRAAIIRSHTLPLLKRAVAAPSRVCLDLALDLLVPPLSYIALNVVALTLVAWWLASSPGTDPWLLLGLACCGTLALYVLRGWQLSGTGPRGLLDLMRAPFFLLWKLAVIVRGSRTTQWVRTDREDG